MSKLVTKAKPLGKDTRTTRAYCPDCSIDKLRLFRGKLESRSGGMESTRWSCSNCGHSYLSISTSTKHFLDDMSVSRIREVVRKYIATFHPDPEVHVWEDAGVPNGVHVRVRINVRDQHTNTTVHLKTTDFLKERTTRPIMSVYVDGLCPVTGTKWSSGSHKPESLKEFEMVP